jgi:hypothetical protein
MMELIDKANVLAELWMLDRDHRVCEYADLGMPYAFGVATGDILDLSPDGEKMVNDAWEYFCNTFALNPNDDLTDLDVADMLDLL